MSFPRRLLATNRLGKIYCAERRVGHRPDQSPRWRLFAHVHSPRAPEAPSGALSVCVPTLHLVAIRPLSVSK